MDRESVDDCAMQWIWDAPRWITPAILAQGFWEAEPLYKPRHNREPFHPGQFETGD